MSETSLIYFCAPTLAGLKTGCLYRAKYTSKSEVLDFARSLNIRLKEKGLRILPLHFSEDSVLIYVYRPCALASDLKNPKAAELLKTSGYKESNYVLQLKHHLADIKNFPHEIGLSLGYPADDVKGFIDTPNDQIYTGYWKVYGDLETAKKKFAQYDKCTKVYMNVWEKHKDITKLAIKA